MYSFLIVELFCLVIVLLYFTCLFICGVIWRKVPDCRHRWWATKLGRKLYLLTKFLVRKWTFGHGLLKLYFKLNLIFSAVSDLCLQPVGSVFYLSFVNATVIGNMYTTIFLFKQDTKSLHLISQLQATLVSLKILLNVSSNMYLYL